MHSPLIILGYLCWTSFSLTVCFGYWEAQTEYGTPDVISKVLNRENKLFPLIAVYTFANAV